MQGKSDHIIRSMSWGVLWRMLRYPFLMLSLFIVPKLMGAELYGRFAIFLSIYMMSEGFTGLGNMQIFGRFLPEHGETEHQRSSAFLHGMLWFGLIIVIGITSIVSVLTLVLRSDDFPPHWIAILILILLLGKIQGTLFSFLYGRNQIGRFSFRALVRSMSRFGLLSVFFIFFGLEGALWSFVANEFILVCISAYWTRDYLFTAWHRPRFAEFFPYLKFGFSFYVPIFLLGLLQRSGIVFIKMLAKGDADCVYAQVSHFDLANQFLILTVSFFAIFMITLVPSLTKMHITNQHERIRQWLGVVLTYCGVLGLLAVNILAYFGRDVIALLGSGFGGTYQSALIMCLAIFPLIIAHVGSNVSVVEKEPRVPVIATLAGLLVMLFLFVMLIPANGAQGAAWSSVIGYVVYACVFMIHYRDLFRKIFKKMMVVMLVAVAFLPYYINVPALPTSALHFTLITITQLLILRALNVINLDHLKQLVSAFRSKV